MDGPRAARWCQAAGGAPAHGEGGRDGKEVVTQGKTNVIRIKKGRDKILFIHRKYYEIRG